MIKRLKPRFISFAKNEDGSFVIQFALWTPVFLVVILSAIELGAVTIRQTALERSMENTIRGIRIGSGELNSHATVKQAICEQAAILPNCMANTFLEMVRLDMINWDDPSPTAACNDIAESVDPSLVFRNGVETEVMLLRACYKYRPITPAGTLSSHLPKDENGYTALVATSAFVTEPS